MSCLIPQYVVWYDMGCLGEDREWANSTPSAGRGGSGRGGAGPARSSAGRGAGPGRGGKQLLTYTILFSLIRLGCTKQHCNSSVQRSFLAH
jgi:hypothetical protein